MGKFGGNNSGIDLYERNIVRLKTRFGLSYKYASRHKKKLGKGSHLVKYLSMWFKLKTYL
jgi:hypothetical protein